MPKIPQRPLPRAVRRVAVRYSIRRVDGEYWAVAFDQGASRYSEADYIHKDREHVCQVARERVNKSYTAEEVRDG